MKLLVGLGIDSSDFNKGLDDAQKKADNFGSRATSGLAKVGGAALMAGAGLAVSGLTLAVKEGIEAESANAKLANTLKNTGEVTGVTMEMVQGLADNMAQLTVFEDDQVIAAGEVLARYKTINKDVYPEMLSLSADLATTLGTSMPEAAALLGKSLAIPGSAMRVLKQAGLVLSEEQTKLYEDMVASGNVAGAQAYLMDQLSGSIGGAAMAAGETTAGKFAILNNQFLQTMETIGIKLIPVILTLLDAFKQVVAWLGANQGVIVAVLAALGVAIGVFVWTVAVPAGIAFLAAWWPVILIMLAVAAAAYGIYMAITHWDEIKAFFAGIWEAIKGFFINLWNSMKDIALKIADWVKGVVTKIGDFGKQFIAAGKAWIEGLWKGITGAFDNVISGIKKLIQGAVDLIKKLLGISSPSRVFAGIGFQMMNGLARGINLNAGMAQAAVAGAISGVGGQIGVDLNPGSSLSSVLTAGGGIPSAEGGSVKIYGGNFTIQANSTEDAYAIFQKLKGK